MTLSFVLIYLQHVIWAQLAIQFMSSTWMIIMLQWFKPLDSNWAVWVETVNEYTTLILLILLMCMTNFLPDLNVKHEIGTVYIVIICIFLTFHLIPIILKVIKQLRMLVMRLFNRLKRV